MTLEQLRKTRLEAFYKRTVLSTFKIITRTHLCRVTFVKITLSQISEAATGGVSMKKDVLKNFAK